MTEVELNTLLKKGLDTAEYQSSKGNKESAKAVLSLTSNLALVIIDLYGFNKQIVCLECQQLQTTAETRDYVRRYIYCQDCLERRQYEEGV